MDDIAKFRDAREAVLKTDTGWLTIAGLFFLTKPDTTFGSDTANDIVLPAGAPARAGTFSLRDGKVAVKAASGVSFVLDGNTITSADLKSDGAGAPDRIVLQDLTLWVHQSGDRLAIRLRDKNNHLRREFTGSEVVSGQAGVPGIRRVHAVRDAEDDADPEHPRATSIRWSARAPPPSRWTASGCRWWRLQILIARKSCGSSFAI